MTAVGIYGWKTPWGTLMLQSETTRGSPRFHYPSWHSSATAGRPTPPARLGDNRKATAVQRIERWLAEEQGVEPVRIPE